jgi:hypothetical protein
VKFGQLEAALLQSFVQDDEAPAIPRQNFRAVTSLRDENEEMAGVEVFFPLAAHNRTKPVDAIAHVDGSRSEQNSHRA